MGILGDELVILGDNMGILGDEMVILGRFDGYFRAIWWWFL